MADPFRSGTPAEKLVSIHRADRGSLGTNALCLMTN